MFLKTNQAVASFSSAFEKVGSWIWLEFSQTSIQIERSKGKIQYSSVKFILFILGASLLSMSLNNVLFLDYLLHS